MSARVHSLGRTALLIKIKEEETEVPTCVLCQITEALEWPSLLRQGPLS